MSDTQSLSRRLGELLTAQRWMLALAESCTGGGIAQAVTDIEGASQWFGHGYVTYSNEAKIHCLQVPEALFQQFGAVSEAVVVAMAQGALRAAQAQMAIAVTGIAGPGGGSPEKPVGTVWFCWAIDHCEPKVTRCYFQGDRQAVRQQAIKFALEEGLSYLQATLNDKTTV